VHLTNSDTIRSITAEWTGERDKTGRPLVADDILERMKLVTTDEAWGVIDRKHGYKHNFAGDFINLHPDRVLVGRAITCRWVPARPDVDGAIERQGKVDGRIGFQNSWVIDEMVEGDVIVVDMFGKVQFGTFAGDNLSTAIMARGQRGMVIDGGIRDTARILEIPDFNGFVRGFDPTGIAEVSMPEINGVTRIGPATCVPGDVVLGTVEGVIFIPPHLAEEVVETSEDVRLKDEFGKQRIAEGVYTPGEIDRDYFTAGDSPHMVEDFHRWREERLDQAAKDTEG